MMRIVGLFLAFAVMVGAARGEEPYALGGGRHLFIDAMLLDTMTGVTIVAHPPALKELVLIADKPWERNGLPAYGTALRDPATGEDRLYYCAVNLDQPPVWSLCLATSTDGIHWKKPTLGIVEWQDSSENNILLHHAGGAMLIDPNGRPERRYLYYASTISDGVSCDISSDGIHFTRVPGKPSEIYSDSQISSFWDDEHEAFLHFPRKNIGGATPRAVGRVAVKAFDANWGLTVFSDDRQDNDLELVMAADSDDPEGMDFYTNAAIKYPRAKGTYLSFLTPYYHYDHPGREYLAEGNSNDGLIETQLAVSRDSIHWTRYRQPYVPNVTHEGLPLKVSMILPGIIVREDRIDQYFAGYTFRHGERNKRRELEGRELGGVFRAEQRLDGFAAIEFATHGGEAVTRPLIFSGKQLQLNVNTNTAGEGSVALLDAAGKEIPPFTMENCRIIHGDHLDKTVDWDGAGADVSSLAGKPVRLKFAFRRARVFAFQFSDEELPTRSTSAAMRE